MPKLQELNKRELELFNELNNLIKNYEYKVGEITDELRCIHAEKEQELHYLEELSQSRLILSKDGKEELLYKLGVVKEKEYNLKENIEKVSIEEEEEEYDIYDIEKCEKIEGNYKGKGTWYSGKIIRKHDDNTYDITYDDGELEANVLKDFIRAIPDIRRYKCKSRGCDDFTFTPKLRPIDDSGNAKGLKSGKGKI